MTRHCEQYGPIHSFTVLAISMYDGNVKDNEKNHSNPIILTLPEPPSANRYTRRSGTHMHISAEAKAYKEAISMLTSRYRNGSEVAFPSGDLSITVLWHRSAKRGDLPNRTKVLYDALQGTIYRDDKQIAHEDTTRVDAHPTLAKGFMSVQISRMVA